MREEASDSGRSESRVTGGGASVGEAALQEMRLCEGGGERARMVPLKGLLGDLCSKKDV